MQSGSVTPKKKIFIETSVLVAASNHVTLSPGQEIEDKFYQESVELLALLKKHFQFRLGLTTKTVETEAKKVLMQAITSSLERNAPDKSQTFEAKSFHWNRCAERLEEHVSYLRIEPTPKELIDPLEKEVRDTYKQLMQLRKNDWQLKKEAREEVEREYVPKPSFYHTHHSEVQRSKDETFNIKYEQKLRENMQLVRLCRTPASRADRLILAEAVLIRRDYAQKEPGTQLYLASCDFNNFSPYFHNELGLSDRVTREIQRKFGVTCDRPVELTKLLRYDLEPPPEEETMDEESGGELSAGDQALDSTDDTVDSTNSA